MKPSYALDWNRIVVKKKLCPFRFSIAYMVYELSMKTHAKIFEISLRMGNEQLLRITVSLAHDGYAENSRCAQMTAKMKNKISVLLCMYC